MNNFTFKFCLCGGCNPYKEDILNHCRIIDGDYFLTINNDLIPIVFDGYVYESSGELNTIFNYVLIEFEYILKFIEFMATKNFLLEININMHRCWYNKFIFKYFKYITKNNITDHLKYYLKNDKFNVLLWNCYLCESLFENSDLSSIRSCLKYIPFRYIKNYFSMTLLRNDKAILNYLTEKTKMYLTIYFTGKKYKGNIFKMVEDRPSNLLNLCNILDFVVFHNKGNTCQVDIYCNIIDCFQELLGTIEDIKIKKQLISEHDKLKSNLMYDDKIKNHLLHQLLIRCNKISLTIIKQLLMDGADINANYDHTITMLDYAIIRITKNKNVDLLDLLFDMGLINQDKINYILERSIYFGVIIDFEKDVKLEIDENFIRELSGYGADVDQYLNELIRQAEKYKNSTLVNYLENLKD